MEQMDAMNVQELSTSELEGTTGATVLGYLVGYCVGYTFGLIANADPHDGNYYCLGA